MFIAEMSGIGMDCVWTRVDARAAVGAPQARKRLFLLAVRRGDDPPPCRSAAQIGRFSWGRRPAMHARHVPADWKASIAACGNAVIPCQGATAIAWLCRAMVRAREHYRVRDTRALGSFEGRLPPCGFSHAAKVMELPWSMQEVPHPYKHRFPVLIKQTFWPSEGSQQLYRALVLAGAISDTDVVLWTGECPFKAHTNLRALPGRQCKLRGTAGQARQQTGLTPNPAFAEWMMGLPPGWSSATPARKQH